MSLMEKTSFLRLCRYSYNLNLLSNYQKYKFKLNWLSYILEAQGTLSDLTNLASLIINTLHSGKSIYVHKYVPCYEKNNIKDAEFLKWINRVLFYTIKGLLPLQKDLTGILFGEKWTKFIFIRDFFKK